jgi:protein-disulfide isomerase
MKKSNLFIALATLVVIASVAGTLYFKSQNAEQEAQAASRNQLALSRAHAPTFGNPAAPVHIVEFFDPACGTCRDFYPLVKDLMAAHPGKIRLSLRYAPFHPGSDQVVKVIEAARRQGQFRQTLEALFATQSVWVVNHTAQPDLIWAPLASLGLDRERLNSDMQSADVSALVAQDMADANTLGVAMTPEYFVNGKPLPNFSFGDLKTLVDDALMANP